MGKTTVFVDETLIRQALQVTELKTKREVIEAGLRELVRKKNQELLQQELGSFDLDLSLRELKKRRAER
jgi:Arc/MetJ family transcription regulator